MIKTKAIRAPRDLVELWRVRFPGVKDADMVRIMWNTSLIKMEAKLREPNVKQKR